MFDWYLIDLLKNQTFRCHPDIHGQWSKIDDNKEWLLRISLQNLVRYLYFRVSTHHRWTCWPRKASSRFAVPSAGTWRGIKPLYKKFIFSYIYNSKRARYEMTHCVSYCNSKELFVCNKKCHKIYQVITVMSKLIYWGLEFRITDSEVANGTGKIIKFKCSDYWLMS